MHFGHIREEGLPVEPANLGFWAYPIGGLWADLVVVIEEADHHFLPGHVAPADLFGGVGVEGIIFGIVEVG